MQAAPDGKCALCRRAERDAAEPPSRLGSLLLLAGVIVSLGFVGYMYKTKAPPPDREQANATARAQAEKELEGIDARLKVLRKAKASGDISPQERTQLDVLEARRRMLTR